MARFEISETVDITPDEYISECDSGELAEIIDILIDEGHISPGLVSSKMTTLHQSDWEETCRKLISFSVRMKMSESEIEFVERLVKEYSTQ